MVTLTWELAKTVAVVNEIIALEQEGFTINILYEKAPTFREKSSLSNRTGLDEDELNMDHTKDYFQMEMNKQTR